MKTFEVKVTFLNGESQTKRSESNDTVTAINMAINRLNEDEKQNICNVNISCVSE